MTSTDYPARITPTTNTLCQAFGCRQKPNALEAAEGVLMTARPVVEGTDLCRWHHNLFPVVLAQLAGLQRDLVHAVVKKSNPSENERVKTSGISDVHSLWNPAAAIAQNELRDWVTYLVNTVLTERPLPVPTERKYFNNVIELDAAGQQHIVVKEVIETTAHTHGMTGSEDTAVLLQAIARWHSLWLSSYPGIGPGLLEEAIDLRKTINDAIDQPGVRRVGIKGQHCHDVISIDPILGPLQCMGQLVGIIPVDEERPSKILCQTNPGHTQISRSEWMDHARG